MHKLADHARKGDFQAAQKLHSTGEWLGVITHALMSSADVAAIGEAAAQLISDDRKQEIERLIDARTAARKAKDFKESDRIRDELAAMGVVLKDSKDGTTWEIAR